MGVLLLAELRFSSQHKGAPSRDTRGCSHTGVNLDESYPQIV
jgi:hypothetical protein